MMNWTQTSNNTWNADRGGYAIFQGIAGFRVYKNKRAVGKLFPTFEEAEAFASENYRK